MREVEVEVEVEPGRTRTACAERRTQEGRDSSEDLGMTGQDLGMTGPDLGMTGQDLGITEGTGARFLASLGMTEAEGE